MKCKSCGCNYDDSERECPMCGTPRGQGGRSRQPHYSSYNKHDYSDPDCTHETYTTYSTTESNRRASSVPRRVTTSQQTGAPTQNILEELRRTSTQARPSTSHSTPYGTTRQRSPKGVKLLIIILVLFFVLFGPLLSFFARIFGNVIANLGSENDSPAYTSSSSDYNAYASSDGSSSYDPADYLIPTQLSGTWGASDSTGPLLTLDLDDNGYSGTYTEQGIKNGADYTETGDFFTMELTDFLQKYENIGVMPFDEDLVDKGYIPYFINMSPNDDAISDHYVYVYLKPDQADTFILYDDGTAPPFPEGNSTYQRASAS